MSQIFLLQEQRLADAQLLMQKLSTIQENTDKLDFDSMLVGKKKTKKSRRRSRSHHHHELTDLDKNINISKDARPPELTSQNSSKLRDILMQKIRVFSRVKLGRNKEIKPKESRTEFHHSTTISNKEINKGNKKSAPHKSNPRDLNIIQPTSTSAPHLTISATFADHHRGRMVQHSQVWHQQKRASNQDRFQSSEETTKTSVNPRKKIGESLKGEIHSPGKHRTNFGPGGIVPEKYNDGNSKRYFPLNMQDAEERSLDIQVDDLSINKSTDNATKDLKVESSVLNTEYLEEYDDPTGPYISKKLISHTKALNRNIVSKTVFIDDSLNEQTENISKTELIDSRAGQTSISLSSIVGIGLGVVMFFLILSGLHQCKTLIGSRN